MDNKNKLAPQVFSDIFDTTPRTDPFQANRSAGRLYERAERIVAALILLTNHISERESYRQEARSVALSLLPQILSLRQEMRAPASTRFHELEANIRHLISLIRILVFAGSISTQNAEIVSGALDDLSTLLVSSARSPLSDAMLFSKEDFLDSPAPYKGHIKDRVSIKDKSLIKDTPVEGREAAGSIAVSGRGGSILGILKDGGELNIRDISAHLPEYGEKTIQRELAMLIQQGVVKRTGLRRWSRYSLV